MTTSCTTPGKKIRSKGKGRGKAVGKGEGPIGRMKSAAYEQGYNDVMEKLAVSPQLALKALQNSMRRAAGQSRFLKTRTPFDFAAKSLQGAPRTLQRALPTVAKGQTPNMQTMNLRQRLYKILQDASGPQGAYALPA